ncbi:hypothetical protein NLX71_25560, partial [Paenibacillus sp. MZ04-78.2]|uniref:hypothetical protein n=1 Tax=Paenibacillus sp. MZ04-78.2 TaxID=2962034 RepID=UPI0020B7D537
PWKQLIQRLLKLDFTTKSIHQHGGARSIRIRFKRSIHVIASREKTILLHSLEVGDFPSINLIFTQFHLRNVGYNKEGMIVMYQLETERELCLLAWIDLHFIQQFCGRRVVVFLGIGEGV